MSESPARTLPRFEVVQVSAGRYCVYDYLKRVAHFPPDLRSFDAVVGLRDVLSDRAKKNGEETLVTRADTPPAQASRNRKPAK